MRDLVQDFRYAARLLLRSPGFTFVAVAALALGIGANTAIFSVVDTLLLRPLPYADADRLAVVWEHNLPRDKKNNVVSPGNFIHWRELNQSFKELSAVSMTFRTTLTGAGDATELPVQYVSGTLFGMLGVRPALGRDFTPQEDAPGVAVVTISDRLWRQRFGADPSIVNRTIMLNGRANLVVGVMPPGFSILDKSVDVWSTVGFAPAARTPRGRWIVRRRPRQGRRVDGAGAGRHGARARRAHAPVPRVQHRLDRERRPAATAADRRGQAGALGDARRGRRSCCSSRARTSATWCSRRATARQRELAVRAALGAGRGRLIRQMLAESVLLSLVGAGRRSRARLVGDDRAEDDGRGAAADREARGGRHRREGPAVHDRRRARQRVHLRHRAGAHVRRREAHRHAEGRRPLGVGRARRQGAQRVRRRRDGAGAGAARRRRTAAAQLRHAAPRRSRASIRRAR